MSHMTLRALRRLRTVRRLRDLELHQARAEQATADATVDRRKQSIQTLETEISVTQALVRRQFASAEGTSADVIRTLSTYERWQTQGLKQHHELLRVEQQAADKARALVISCFESLSIIERLIERRQHQAVRESLHADQLSLDEGAMIVESHRIAEQATARNIFNE